MEIIKVNIVPGGAAPVCHASQYDKGRTIRCKLFNGASAYSIANGDSISLDVRKPDNHLVTMNLTATEGNDYVDITTTEQMTAAAGNNICELKIANGGTEIGTANFLMAVEKAPADGGVQSDSEFVNLASQVENIVTTTEYPQLQTINKTILGAINELDQGGGGGASWTDVTGTLQAGNTTITLSDYMILASSTIDVYVNDVFYGVNPTSISIVAGSVTLTFEAQTSDMAVKVRVT